MKNVFACIVIFGVAFFVTVAIYECSKKPTPICRVATQKEKDEMRPLLKKHGLLHHVAVIRYDEQGAYYIDKKGRRCAFR